MHAKVKLEQGLLAVAFPWCMALAKGNGLPGQRFTVLHPGLLLIVGASLSKIAKPFCLPMQLPTLVAGYSQQVPSGQRRPHAPAMAMTGPSAASSPGRTTVWRNWRLHGYFRYVLVLLCAIVLAGTIGPATVLASSHGADVTMTRPHLGQRLATLLREALQLPDWAILMLLSAMPLIELRGGVPVGLWMGMPVGNVMFLCVAGNMLPIPLIVGALRSRRIRRLFMPVLKIARGKTRAISDEQRWVGVAAFVGVPLPGTGAWSGAMVAHFVGMDFCGAVTSILAGVCVAACIMTSLTLAGWYGCSIFLFIISIAGGSRLVALGRRGSRGPSIS